MRRHGQGVGASQPQAGPSTGATDAASRARVRVGHWPWLLAGVFLLALLPRVWWVRHWILPPYGDQSSLERFAANVAQGLYYGTHGAYWPPAFIFLAGFVERFLGTGHSFLAVRTVDAVLGAATAVLAADIGRRLTDSRAVGVLAGVLWALYRPGIYYTDAFLSVTLGTLTFLAVIDALLWFRPRPTAWRLVACGVLLGLGTLTKPTELPLIIPAFVYFGLRRPRGFDLRFAALATAGILAVALAVNVPWTVRNLRVTGAPVFVDVNGGVNFYIAHNPRATGEWMNLGNHNPVLARGDGYDRPLTNRLALDAGMRYFLGHPGADLRTGSRVLTLFWGERDPDIAHYGQGLAPLTVALHLPLIGFHLLRDLGLFGVAVLLLRWRRTALLPVTLFGYSLGLALLFFAPRYRLPVEPLLAVAAATALVQLGIWFRQTWQEQREIRHDAVPWS